MKILQVNFERKDKLELIVYNQINHNGTSKTHPRNWVDYDFLMELITRKKDIITPFRLELIL